MDKREIDKFSLDGIFIETFESVKQAHEITGVSVASLCLACRGKYKKAGGFIWRYNNSKYTIQTDPLDKLLELDDDEDEEF